MLPQVHSLYFTQAGVSKIIVVRFVPCVGILQAIEKVNELQKRLQCNTQFTLANRSTCVRCVQMFLVCVHSLVLWSCECVRCVVFASHVRLSNDTLAHR